MTQVLDIVEDVMADVGGDTILSHYRTNTGEQSIHVWGFTDENNDLLEDTIRKSGLEVRRDFKGGRGLVVRTILLVKI
jgi:hypothetical protein